MTAIRTSIQKIIEINADPVEAALLVCEFLEDRIGLWGNGWFDGDKVLEARLGVEDEEE